LKGAAREAVFVIVTVRGIFAAMAGEVKLLTPLTMENIADSVLAEALASKAELDRLIDDLYQFARNPGTISGTPRIVQAWGYWPAR
jgi:hypothetical protein